jgi:cardiolipin synthase
MNPSEALTPLAVLPSLATESSAAVSVGSNRVRLLRDGVAAFPVMLEAIAGARREVLLEMYWIGNDRVGQSFRAALLERAQAGVRVRVLFDPIGSLETPAAFWVPLLEAGVEIDEYSPISPFKRRFRLARMAHRDHRKLLVVDSEIAVLGGINIGEPWSPPGFPEKAWRDDDVEIRGPAAGVLRTAFYDVWRRAGREVDREVLAVPSREDEVQGVRVLTNRIEYRPNQVIQRAYLSAVRHAAKSIDITSAYFLPGLRFLRALRRAARRGVRVRLLIPAHSDVLLVALAMNSLYGRLLSDGAEVFAYEPRVLHAKTATFDGQFAMIGSHNLDTISWRFNLECNVMVESAEFTSIMTESFERDLRDAKKLELSAWQSRPAWLRLLGWFAALFQRLL